MLSISNLVPARYKQGWRRKLLVALDSVLGVKRLNKLYQQHAFSGLSAIAFCQRFTEVFQLQVNVRQPDIPASGPVIVVANHPYGGLEGVLLAQQLLSKRPDVRILGNRALALFPELASLFIYTNPLRPNAPGNVSSLKACANHLRQGGLLLVFPAGRVSYPLAAGQPVRDHQWHPMVASLANNTNSQILPVHISGQNRTWFYRLGLVYYRFRLLMLVREMLASKGKSVTISFGKAMPLPGHIKDKQQMTDMQRLASYLQDKHWQAAWPDISLPAMQPLATPVSGEQLSQQLATLPAEQALLSYKHFTVYYVRQQQVPLLVQEIQRLREQHFRQLDEGSGKPADADAFDQSYLQLFVFDHQAQQVIGAYRMGQTDMILKQQGIDGLYLNRMFHFGPDFINQQQACLEMGRSFLISRAQRSYHGLLLLFKGIGAFVCRYPQYGVLYGTVSLSRQYQPLSVALMAAFLAKPDAQVSARQPFQFVLPDELKRYLDCYPADIDTLDFLVRQVEPDGKGLPVLLRQYHQLGARFYTVAIDPNFAATPGFLLSVNLRQAPERLLKLYLAEGVAAYLANDKLSGAVALHGLPA